jgi:hypothetical protein
LLGQALEELLPLELWARTNGHVNVQNDALWEMYLCHSRMGSFPLAADVLQSLRRNVEKQRAGIADPMQRGGVGLKYPYLYSALCQMLLKAGRTEELLGAIEGAKGRAVADLMAQRLYQPIDELEFAAPAARLSGLMVRLKSHYISYFVDDDSTIAVLVDKQGAIHESGPILLGKNRIRNASRYVDPRMWGSPDPANLSGPDVESLSKSLGPLLSWLEPFFDDGTITKGDHVCYSPDEHIHQIPLAYISFMGEPLVRKVSLSRTHGARALSLILNRQAVRPQEYVGIVVPARQDLNNKAMLKDLREPIVWLERHLRGTKFLDEAATTDAICGATLSERVVHFSTHGVFPSEDEREPRSPFEHSGLVLAGEGGLPDKDRLALGEGGENVLTPRRVLDIHPDLSSTHLTLQACVTGLAREGIGGDALGLDWALLQLGASSLLTSHWNISAKLSAEFCTQFYRSWLEKGNTRAVAWREAVLRMMDGNGEFAKPYAWAAFSLSGDWR